MKLKELNYTEIIVSALIGAVVGWFLSEMLNRTVKHKLPGKPA